jgi:hypothetical protein
MPYLIYVQTPGAEYYEPHLKTGAAATIEDVRSWIIQHVVDAVTLDSGGPLKDDSLIFIDLPDGTRVQIEWATRSAILDAIGFHVVVSPHLSDDQWPWPTSNIVAAYNELHGTPA